MLNLDYRDPRPIYEQVKEGLKKLMVTGGLQEGEKVPSVRALAASLAINPNTIQRAYGELEAEGYLCSVPGKGSFVAQRRGVDPARLEKLWKALEETCAELEFLGVSREEMVRRVSKAEEGVEA